MTFSHKKKRSSKAFREWSWVFEKCLGAVDEGYMKDLKETMRSQIVNLTWS